MKIIISPAKKMKIEEDIDWETIPSFLPETRLLMGTINAMSSSDKKAMWNCSDAIAKHSEQLFNHMDLYGNRSPALFSYNGIQYQAMAPEAFTTTELAWLQDHLRILSGFYGVVRPLDGIVPYRLEMQAKLTIHDSDSLYHFWGRKLYEAVMDDSRILINLASKEYSDAITPWIDPTRGPADQHCLRIAAQWKNCHHQRPRQESKRKICPLDGRRADRGYGKTVAVS